MAGILWSQTFYAGVDGVEFTEKEPWTLFELPELSLVVAGLTRRSSKT